MRFSTQGIVKRDQVDGQTQLVVLFEEAVSINGQFVNGLTLGSFNSQDVAGVEEGQWLQVSGEDTPEGGMKLTVRNVDVSDITDLSIDGSL